MSEIDHGNSNALIEFNMASRYFDQCMYHYQRSLLASMGKPEIIIPRRNEKEDLARKLKSALIINNIYPNKDILCVFKRKYEYDLDMNKLRRVKEDLYSFNSADIVKRHLQQKELSKWITYKHSSPIGGLNDGRTY